MTKLYKATKEIFHLTIPQNATRADAIKICELCYIHGHGDDQELLDTFDTEEEADAFAQATEPEMSKSITSDGNIQLTIKVCFINIVTAVDILDTYYLNAVSAEQMVDYAFSQSKSDEDDDDEEKPMKQIWKIGVENYSTTVNRYRRYEAERKIENIYAESSCNSVVEQWAFDSEEKALAFAETLEPELDIRIESNGCHILVTEINIGCKMVEDDEDDFDINRGCDEYECVKHITTDEIISRVFPPAADDDDNEEE